jgi:UDP-GlcNAc:undecaprenyl-phosphate/decaprenyl-phosphate GlcNAc-1-phosphate transferase
MLNIPFESLAVSVGISALLCISIILSFARISKHSPNRNDTAAVQASHSKPTSRIGGLAIVMALVVVALLFHNENTWDMYVFLLVSTVPVFSIGLAEDLGYFASPRKRLFAAAISGIVFIVLIGEWVQRTGIPGLDNVLYPSFIAIVFSLFLSVGISHAFNLIDGLNGLAGSTALAAALALAIIASQTGLTGHRDILLIIAAAILGFLIFNFPFGKIFLGDAGAYMIGHLLVWMSISILWNAPNVTPLAMLLIFFWPIADTLLAIIRRLCLGKPIAQPDRLHFHQLVMRGVEIVILGREKRRIANPLATLFTLPFIFAPMIGSLFFALNNRKAAIACVVFAIIFITSYKVGIWLVPKLRRSTYKRYSDIKH